MLPRLFLSVTAHNINASADSPTKWMLESNILMSAKIEGKIAIVACVVEGYVICDQLGWGTADNMTFDVNSKERLTVDGLNADHQMSINLESELLEALSR
ncbi:hypothetical protein PsYK624_136150 [Phanerochaete sordida]|uniref:Uncharacterized protein n=1 Tax=Phanerochaete sordida TaxID=48140 RepID=A0A9P3GK64_9APHY|nr:hypothetical protein PsYK624_136150 [Phanerochaete sordida]